MNPKSVELVPEKSTVILRLDLDLPVVDGKILDSSRLKKSLPTINLLLSKSCQLVIIGHFGRPKTRDEKYSLKPVYLEFLSLLESDQSQNSLFLDDPTDVETLKLALSKNQIIFIENLRFWPDEETASFVFLQPLIDQSQAFVNDAIAVAHRPSASMTLNRVLPGYYGLNFLVELSHLQKLATSPHPLTVILGGSKLDKLDYLPDLTNIADHILVGGKLPQFKTSSDSDKIYCATLTPDTFDIDSTSIARFKEILSTSQTIIWSGALGFYENPAFRTGTIEIAKAIAESNAVYKIIAGGDTSASIRDLGLSDKISFICSGGGVLLEFLTKGTLPALE